MKSKGKKNIIIKDLKKKEEGITLIALVITIIVLLILAGIVLNLTIGQNGIFTRAEIASNTWENAKIKEKLGMVVASVGIDEVGYKELSQNSLQNELNKYFDDEETIVRKNQDETFTVFFKKLLKDYIIEKNEIKEGIDWKKAMKNAVAPESQNEKRNEGVIGIGTDGKSVNMDLWEYTVLSDNTVGLNDKDSLNDVNKNKGYLGSFEHGNIMDTIPQYISIDNGKNYLPVSTMVATFCETTELSTMPELPTTVIDLTNCFIRCKNLVNIYSIPTSVKKSVSTFKGCTSVRQATEIPISVKDISSIFEGCVNLTKGPSLIPNNVEIMSFAFLNCENLQGEITIEANLNGKIIIEPYQTDFYRSFFDASLSSNNASLKVYLKGNLYELFTNNRANIINTSLSNSNIEFIQVAI